MSAKYEPLKRVVAYFLDQYKKSTEEQDRNWVLAFRGLEKLHYNISAEPKTVRLTVNGNITVSFPDDYVQWVKVGVMNQNGEISTLRVNKALTNYADASPSRLTLLTPDIVDGWVNNSSMPYLNFYNNGLYTTLYGVGQAGIIGYGECKIDEDNGIIILNPKFQYSEVLFEYISSPEKDTDYKVYRRLREAIIAFLEWKNKLNTRQNFYAEAIEARRCIQPINMQSFNQTIRLNEKMTINI